MRIADLLNTIYLTDDYVTEIDYLLRMSVMHVEHNIPFTEDIYDKKLSSAINEAVTSGHLNLDLAGCRFTGKVWASLAYIKSHQGILSLCDTEDIVRDTFIQDYMKFTYEYEDLPHIRGFDTKPRDLKSIMNWIETLSTDVVYELIDLEYTSNPAFVVTLNILAPDIKVIVDKRSVMEYAKLKFSKYLLNECKHFMFLYGSQSEPLEVWATRDRQIHIVNIGDIDQTTFVKKYVCMPWFIGNERVSMRNASDTLRDSIRSVFLDVSSYLDERPTTIETYFPFKEVYT